MCKKESSNEILLIVGVGTGVKTSTVRVSRKEKQAAIDAVKTKGYRYLGVNLTPEKCDLNRCDQKISKEVEALIRTQPKMAKHSAN